jgi:iron complex outermembrane receptor protein
MQKPSLARAALALACLSAACPPAFAADTAADQSPTQLKEIVVTAEKRAQNLEKAPATVSVVTGAQLVDRGVQDISEATVDFPSVKFGQISGTTHLYIRGIGAEQDRASIDPLVTMTENGVTIPREITGNNLFDVSEIQVLPGPQSTLYGTSAAGGVVSIIDNRPVNSRQGNALFEIGNYDSKHVSLMENVPLSDTL